MATKRYGDHFLKAEEIGQVHQPLSGIFTKLYIPRTQMTLVLNGKGLVLGGLTFKNRGQLGSRYIYIYI